MALPETVTKIKTMMEELNVELDSFMTKGNKQAAKRARKVTLNLEKDFKIFRKESVQSGK